jgi:hypothetical protein
VPEARLLGPKKDGYIAGERSRCDLVYACQSFIKFKKALGKQFGKQDLRYQHVTWIDDGGEPPR